ncbi:hypothetical protein P7C70_g6846, partial [Phenoliferia sp. Uapishka_3]
MPAYRSHSPDFVILSTDPPTSSPAKTPRRKVVGRMSTGGPAKLRAMDAQAAKIARSAEQAKVTSRMSSQYEWPAKNILKEDKTRYKIDFWPATLTPSEFAFWSARELFASHSVPDARGCICVVFLPTWQAKKKASDEPKAKWNSRWEIIVLSEDEDE